MGTATVQAHEGTVNALCITADGEVLVSGSADNRVRGWSCYRTSTIDDVAKNLKKGDTKQMTQLLYSGMFDKETIAGKIKEQNGKTLLIMAVEAGDTSLVKTLLSWGADPEITDDDFNTPMSVGRKSGFTEIVEILQAHRKATTS